MSEDKAVSVFHPAEYICEELQARGWTTADLVAAAGGDAVDILAVDLYLCVHQDSVIIGSLSDLFARGFGTSVEYWRDLHQAWLDNPDVREPFEAPDELLSGAPA